VSGQPLLDPRLAVAGREATGFGGVLVLVDGAPHGVLGGGAAALADAAVFAVGVTGRRVEAGADGAGAATGRAGILADLGAGGDAAQRQMGLGSFEI